MVICKPDIVHRLDITYIVVLPGSPSRGGHVAVYIFDENQPSLPTPFYSVLVSIYVFMKLSTVSTSLNSPDNSPLSHSISSGFVSAVLVLTNICLLMKVSFSSDTIFRGRLGLKHQLTDSLTYIVDQVLKALRASTLREGWALYKFFFFLILFFKIQILINNK